MNPFIEYVCHGVIRSENAIKRLNKNVSGLTKCCLRTNARVTCVVVAVALITTVVVMQDKEIKALERKVSDLSAKIKTHDTTEGQTEREGA